MDQRTFEFMTQREHEEASEVELDERTIEVLVGLMAKALIAVVNAAVEVSDAE